MEPFSLEEYLANPSRKVVTKKGRPVRIVCTDAKRRYPIIALVKFKEEELNSYLPDGRWSFANKNGDMNLFFAPEKKEGWVNIYKMPDTDGFEASCIFKTKEDARIFRGDNYVATTKITWEDE